MIGIEQREDSLQSFAYEEIKVGDSASFSKTVSEKDINQYAEITGDFNPIHVDKAFAERSPFKERIAHGMLTAGFISNVLGTKLPGVNTIYISQSLNFIGPVKIGDTVSAKVTVIEKMDKKKMLRLQTTVYNQDGETVVDGEATVMKRN